MNPKEATARAMRRVAERNRVQLIPSGTPPPTGQGIKRREPLMTRLIRANLAEAKQLVDPELRARLVQHYESSLAEWEHFYTRGTFPQPSQNEPPEAKTE